MSALAVAGLVAVAAPAVVSVGSEIGTWAPFNRPTAAPATAPTSTATAAPGSTAAPKDETGIPDGYVDVGHGTYIPAGGPGECTSSTYIWIGSDNGEPMHFDVHGEGPVDMGPNEFAKGEVSLDAQGRPEMYTVAAGDVLSRITDRFCFSDSGGIGMLNGYSHGAVIQPGDVLTLNVNLITDWVYPYADE